MDIVEIVVPLFIIFMAFWRRDIFLYIMSGVASIALGLAWYIEYRTTGAMAITIVLGGIGLYSLFLAIENLLGRGE